MLFPINLWRITSSSQPTGIIKFNSRIAVVITMQIINIIWADIEQSNTGSPAFKRSSKIVDWIEYTNIEYDQIGTTQTGNSEV